MTGKIRFLIALIALAGVFVSAQTASAAPATWTVVSSASIVSFDADVGPGFTKTFPQGIGLQGLPSLSAHYGGTISGDVTGPMLTISSAVLDAIVTGSWSPLPGGGVGTADADYGAFLVGAVGGDAAIRDFVYNADTLGPRPVVGTTWDATGVALDITSGTLDYLVPAFALAGSESLIGVMSSNSPSAGDLSTVGMTETLILPIVIFDSTSLDLSGIPVLLTITGTIVATRTIPEPGTFVMLGLGAALLLPAAVRRYRRR